MSLSFLFCKPWHPATTWNQKKIWEAEQKDAKTKRDEAAANKELYRDSERRRYEHMAGGKGEPDSSTTALNFMYAPPPGYQQPQEEELNEDDEAVKKFKALAKMKSDPNFSSATACSELEKLVGRRINPGVSLAEQQERFPFLKDAPVEHAYATGVKVNFKPFNNVIRHVRCMRCGEWGHRSGDRECKLINENPNDTERRLREDPMSYMSSAGREGGAAAVVPPGGDFGEDGDGDDADSAFVNSLSSKKKRRLLRLLQKMEAGDGQDHQGEGEEEDDGRKSKKTKKERKKSSEKRSRDDSSGRSRQEASRSRRRDEDRDHGEKRRREEEMAVDRSKSGSNDQKRKKEGSRLEVEEGRRKERKRKQDEPRQVPSSELPSAVEAPNAAKVSSKNVVRQEPPEATGPLSSELVVAQSSEVKAKPLSTSRKKSHDDTGDQHDARRSSEHKEQKKSRRSRLVGSDDDRGSRQKKSSSKKSQTRSSSNRHRDDREGKKSRREAGDRKDRSRGERRR